ncbi:MAG: hypothetical protein HPY71_14185 [Firmicutes bacterium]|nr:hypothetical protein [Bacillota bacterium]
MAQELYLLFEYIPQPHTLFAGVKRCPPGTVIRIDPGKPGVACRPYFDLGARVLERIDAAGEPHSELIHRTWRLSTEKVLQGLNREETVGISLSGGLDSRFLLGSVCELGVKCVAYTYGVNEHVSDVLIARDVATHFNTAWHYFEFPYEPGEVEGFLSRYFPMEPVSMAGLASVARDVKERLGINYTMVAAGGDVVWGSHCSIKNMVKAAKAVRMWRRYCRTWKSAWVAASELGDWGWAVGRKEWERPLQNAGKVFDEAVDHRWDRLPPSVCGAFNIVNQATLGTVTLSTSTKGLRFLPPP